MSVQQAAEWNYWEKSVIRHGVAFLRTAVTPPSRDRLVLSALVVLLMGMLLLGTTAFGMDEKDCLSHYERYGWAPKECGEFIEVQGEAPDIFEPPPFSCGPDEMPTTWGDCVPRGGDMDDDPHGRGGSGGGRGGGGRGGGTTPPSPPDPCKQCRAEFAKCEQEVFQGQDSCLAWAFHFAENACGNHMRNCDGTLISTEGLNCRARSLEERLLGTQCTGPSVDKCIHECVSGRRDATTTTTGISVSGKYFGFDASQTVTVSPREGLAKGCLDLSYLAGAQCTQNKIGCDRAAQCPHPGSIPLFKYEAVVRRKYPNVQLDPDIRRPRLNIPR